MNTCFTAKFKLGQIVATPNALEALQRNGSDGRTLLRRHAAGDWGAVCKDDAALNDLAIQDGSRILSAYLLPDETTFWIITDATIDDEGTRQVTTLLLPEDY